MNRLESNIWKLYAIKALKWFMVAMPIIVVFFQDLGLSLQEIMILQGSYSFMVAVMEIPSGYLADVIGRKKSLLIGAILTFIGFLIISISYEFWPFLFAELILGIGASFISGSDSALMYDTLLETNKTKEYTKIEGRTYAIGNFSEAFAGITGGFLAELSLRFPWYLQTGLAFLIIPITILLIEPNVHKKIALDKNFRGILKVVQYALIENKLLKWFIIFSSIIGFSTLSMAWFAQPLFKAIELPLKWFGFLWCILNLSTGFSSSQSYKLESKFNFKQLIILFLIGIGIPVIGLSFNFSFYSLACVFIVYLVRGLATPVLRNFINTQTDSEIRATVLSIRSFCIRLTFSILAPLLGWISDVWSLNHAFLFMGIFLLSIGGISTYKLILLSNK